MFLQHAVLPFLKKRAWFNKRNKPAQECQILDIVAFPKNKSTLTLILLVEVIYAENIRDTYHLPLLSLEGGQNQPFLTNHPESIIAHYEENVVNVGAVIDACHHPLFHELILNAIAEDDKRGTHQRGWIQANSSDTFKEEQPTLTCRFSSSLSEGRQTHAIQYDLHWFLKMYRYLEFGVNTEHEVLTRLNRQDSPCNVPTIVGQITHRLRGEARTLGYLQKYVTHEGNGWTRAIDSVQRYYQSVLTSGIVLPKNLPIQFNPHQLPPRIFDFLSDSFMHVMRLLGKRTAELHQALAEIQSSAFDAEPFNAQHQRSIFQQNRSKLKQTVRSLRKNLSKLPSDVQPLAQTFLAQESSFEGYLSKMLSLKINATKTRTHGNFQLFKTAMETAR